MIMFILLLLIAFLAATLSLNKRRLRSNDFDESCDDELEYYVDESLLADSDNRILEPSLSSGCMPSMAHSMDWGIADSNSANSGFDYEGIGFTAFAPDFLHPGYQHELVVWAHKPKDWLYVLEKAQLLEANRVAASSDGFALRPMDTVTIQMVIDEIQVDESIASFSWLGTPTSVSFLLSIPKQTRFGDYFGKLIVFCNGIRIGRLVVRLAIVPFSSNCAAPLASLPIEANFLKSAFASYSRRDRKDVLARIQGIKKVLPDIDIFMDVVSLRSGDMWERRIKEEIESREKFFLFWSSFASRSKWVEIEWRHALLTKGLSSIDPIPLECIEIAPPPTELSALNFSDLYSIINQSGGDRSLEIPLSMWNSLSRLAIQNGKSIDEICHEYLARLLDE